MNSNIKIFLLCPVPEEQKPINEYIGLKENELTTWLTFSEENFQKKIFSFFLFFVMFFSLLTIGSVSSFFFEINYLFEWFLLNFTFAINSILFLIIINFVRWKQIANRFNKPRLFYEEASWYDGQIWEKPFSIIKNDKLLSTQKIQPIIERIFRTVFTIFSLDLFLIIVFEIQ